MLKFATFLFFICLSFSLNAQIDDMEEIARFEIERHKNQNFHNSKRVFDAHISIKKTQLHLNPNLNNAYLIGVAKQHFYTTQNIQSITFDLRAELVVDSVKWHNQSLTFSHNHTSHLLTIDFNEIIQENTEDSLEIFYQGFPNMSERYYTRFVHASGPVVATLSQPYGAPYWFPCRDNLSQKINELYIKIELDTPFVGVANGIPVKTETKGNKRIYHWHHQYPIATYLIAFTAARYQYHELETTLKSTGKKLKIGNYMYPHYHQEAQSRSIATIEIMQLFDSLFGTYPFDKEWYGHAQFSFSGGMEHQTMSFMGNLGYNLVAHELAHQWFGDKITCGTWKDLWLNESFATYLNLLCYNYLRPNWEWQENLIKFKNEVMAQPGGSVTAYDTSRINTLFNYRTTYQKGAMVLHQLRWMLGDEVFYKALRNYLNSPRLAYGFAVENDLKFFFETESGKDLTDYFRQWFNNEGFPTYNIKWEQKGAELIIQVNQTQSVDGVEPFMVDLPILMKSSVKDTLLVLKLNQESQIFTFPFSYKFDSLVFDPQNWILAKHNIVFKLNTNEIIYPNPFNNEFFIFNSQGDLNYFEVIDLNGKLILKSEENSDKNTINTINLEPYSNGVYFIKLHYNQSIKTFKIIKQQ